MVLAVIPARYHSNRFPGKALVPVDGVPLVALVAGRVVTSGVADRVIVATDHRAVAEASRRVEGVEVWSSGQAYRSGSDRVAAAVAALGAEADVVLNVQADEALVSRALLEQAVAALAGNFIGTVAVPVGHLDLQLLDDPDTVKVQVDADGRAVDFSRRRLPGHPLAHVGIYSFTRDSLAEFAGRPSSVRERTERLEQLRCVEARLPIGVAVVAGGMAAVNRPGNLTRLEALLDSG
jgi:3-deoxy-manno-octulosonate cytidylyltransferase (CMP-KDO synthetase)